MVLSFYRFTHPPFSDALDPAFLLLSPGHKTMFRVLRDSIKEKQGLVAIIGEAGLGKTTIVRSYLQATDPQHVKTIYICSPNLSFRELFERIYREFSLKCDTDDLVKMIEELRAALIEEYKQGRNVALLIDDAHTLSVLTLVNLLMLANLETEAEKLLQIVLIGQTTLQDKLKHPTLWQLKKRLVMHAPLSPLTKKESAVYIEHQLAKVLTRVEPIFTKRAMRRIIAYAQGNPRMLNILCVDALNLGALQRQQPISPKLVRQVIADFEPQTTHSLWRWALACSAAVLLAGIAWNSPYKDLLVSKIATLELSALRRSVFPGRHGTPPADVAIPGEQTGPVLSPAQEASPQRNVPQALAFPPRPEPEASVARAPVPQAPPAQETSLPQETSPQPDAMQEVRPTTVATPLLSSETACLSDVLYGRPCRSTAAPSPPQETAIRPTGTPVDAAVISQQKDCILNTLLGKPCAFTPATRPPVTSPMPKP